MNPELRTAGYQALREAREELQKTGSLSPIFLIWEKDGKFLRFDLTGEYKNLMNSGGAKAAIFGFVREWIRERQSLGVVFVTDMWMSVSTEQGRKVGPKELMRMHAQHGSEHLAKLGFVKRTEAACATIQSPEAVMTLSQPYERDQRLKLITFAPVVEQEFKQDQFTGRQKMFGDLSPRNVS